MTIISNKSYNKLQVLNWFNALQPFPALLRHHQVGFVPFNPAIYNDINIFMHPLAFYLGMQTYFFNYFINSNHQLPGYFALNDCLHTC